MGYVQFITSDSQRYVDSLDYNYLVRSNGLYLYKLSDYRDYFYNTPLSVSFNFYFLYSDETIRQDLTPYLLEGGQLTINNENGVRRKLNIELSNREHWKPSPVAVFCGRVQNLNWKYV